MNRGRQGTPRATAAGGEKAAAFLPRPLPPEPPVDWNPRLRAAFDEALLALGRLDSVAGLLPSAPLFLYLYVRKEAVLSSMIEGTQASLSDLLLHELDQEPGVPLADVTEVSNYVAAMATGLGLLEEGVPLSLRLLKQVHGVLLGTGGGSGKNPGEFRRSQNWIGGTRPGNALFVPPPPEEVTRCMGALELFLHGKPEATSALVKAALAHVQFETIHPFLDGNGRLGRLLVTFILCAERVLRKPLLYLSLYFKEHRNDYYELLTLVRETGDWEAWLEFFAEAVAATSEQAAATATRLNRRIQDDRAKIISLGRRAASAEQIHFRLMEHPIVTPGWLAVETGLSPATVNKALASLADLGILRETTAKKRNRIFAYQDYMAIMNEGIGMPLERPGDSHDES